MKSEARLTSIVSYPERGASELERIYAKIEGYKRTREQQHWKEKVRQTLQYHPNVFT